jgi:hypothetical protein
MPKYAALPFLLSSLVALSACAQQSLPAKDPHTANDADRAAIQEVLDNYTHSVNTGDRALFESQLLEPSIPFFGLRGTLKPSFAPNLGSVQQYAGFRAAIFESGKKYKQRFSNVKIESDGDLAQVSLDFETIDVESGSGGQGWKVIQLLRVAGHWKIASEFYTAYPLGSNAPPRG